MTIIVTSTIIAGRTTVIIIHNPHNAKGINAKKSIISIFSPYYFNLIDIVDLQVYTNRYLYRNIHFFYRIHLL